MTVSRVAARVAGLLFVVVTGALSACKDSPTPPVVVTQVEVSSPLGPLLDVGTSTTLSAKAEDRAGHAVAGAAFTWSSSGPSVASVDGVGLLRALTIGDAAITAATDGVNGHLDVRVVEADRDAIGALSADALLAPMLAKTSADARGRLQAAIAECADGATVGHLEHVQECVAAIRQEAAAATDPTDRALLAALLLVFDQVERRIGL